MAPSLARARLTAIPGGAVSDPYNQRRVPSPRAAGIAYPEPISAVAGRGPRTTSALDMLGQVAAPSQIERYPIITGRALTLEVVSSRFRLALTGYRQLYVDMLNELLERDPHAYGVLSKRVLAVANATYRPTPPKLPKDAPDADTALAEQIADEYENDIGRIPRWQQHRASLAWGDYYGLQGAEVIWDYDAAAKHWRPGDLVMIHSRRLSYPDPWRWDLYVWDQGAVIGSPFGDARLPEGIFGWRVADYPGKFVVHAPQLRADYPTREGLGRQLAYWMVLKHTAARAAPDYLERFSNPPMDISWRTGQSEDKRRAAVEDIAQAEAAVRAGVLRAWAHPDTLGWEIKAPDGVGGRAKVTFVEWADYCDSQVTKAVLGSTLGTDVGSTGGNRALGAEQRKDTLRLYQYSAQSLADSLDDSLTRTWCQLNYPDRADLWPHLVAVVEDDPDPMDLMDRAAKGAGVGLPIDADELGKMVGLPLVAKDDPDARVLRPVQPQPPSAPPQAPQTAGNNADTEQAPTAAPVPPPPVPPPGVPAEGGKAAPRLRAPRRPAKRT